MTRKFSGWLELCLDTRDGHASSLACEVTAVKNLIPQSRAQIRYRMKCGVAYRTEARKVYADRFGRV